MLYLMEIFVLICLGVVAAVALFWLVIFPAGLLGGAVVSIIKGAARGFRAR